MSGASKMYRCKVCGLRHNYASRRGAPPIYCPSGPCAEFGRMSSRWESAARHLFAHPGLALDGERGVSVKSLRMRLVVSVEAAAARVVDGALDEAEDARRRVRRGRELKGTE